MTLTYDLDIQSPASYGYRAETSNNGGHSWLDSYLGNGRQISLATGGTLTLKRPANHVVLVRLTLDQFVFWPKLPPNAGFGIKNLEKNFSGG